MKPVYYVSRVKTEAERRYTEAELVLSSLVYACRKFKSYLLTKPFVILTNYTLLPQLVNGTMLSKGMMRWLVELQEYDFSFLVEDMCRATLADLLTYKEGPILVKEVDQKVEREEHNVIPRAHVLYFDGSYKKSIH